MKEWVNVRDFEKIERHAISWFWFICTRGPSLWFGKACHWDVSQLYWYKLDIIKIFLFRFMISLTPGGLYTEAVTQNGHLIALLCLPVSDLSPPVKEVMTCASFRYPHAVLSGSVLMPSSQLTLKSVFHILNSCFSTGKSPFCLPEVLVPFPMTRRVITIPFSKC